MNSVELMIKNRISICKKLEQLVSNSNIEEAKKIIKEEDSSDYTDDLEYASIKAAIYYTEGDCQKAKETLEKIYFEYEFTFDINYNLGIFSYELKEDKDAIRYFVKCLMHNGITKEIEQDILNCTLEIFKSGRVKKTDYDEMVAKESNLRASIHSKFPMENLIEGELKLQKEDYIGKHFEINNVKYYVGIYDNYYMERDGISTYTAGNENTMDLYKSETYRGKSVKNKELNIEKSSVVGIMPKTYNQKITIHAENSNNEKIKLTRNELLKDHYYFYRLEANSKVDIKSDKEMIVSDTIKLEHKGNRPKLVLNLFIDGLPKKFTDEYSLEKCMPNTYEFFKEGCICNNSYANSEWTLPSLASVFSGKRVANHRVYHNTYSTENLYKMKLFSEIFDENDYMCTMINGDWRSTPVTGYAKGMTRNLYQPSKRGMFTDENVIETIEHLEAFKETDNFMWISIPEIHDIADEYENKISTQVNTSLKYRNIEITNATSVQKVYDEGKIERLKCQLHRMDAILLGLYSYITKNYKEDEFIVSMISDHGQGYIMKKEDMFLDDGRSKATMMFRGKNIHKGECNELVEGIDYFPILLKSAGIEEFNLQEANIPKYFGGEKAREYTLSESLHVGKPYRAVVNDLKYKFFFDSEKVCTDDGLFDACGYKIKLVEKATNKDVTEDEIVEVEKYKEIVLKNIKRYISKI